jgi:hypothetical protein
MRLGPTWIVLLVVALAVIAFLVVKGKQGGEGKRFKARAFMTPNELEFLGRLEAAVPELRIHAQVAMGALLAPEVAKGEDARAYMSARGHFSQKIIDFVAQSRSTGEVVAIIELDDRTHNKAKDESRDAMLREASYKVIRWQSKSKPDRKAIRQTLLEPTAISITDNKPAAKSL